MAPMVVVSPSTTASTRGSSSPRWPHARQWAMKSYMRPYKNARAIWGLAVAVYYLNRKGELVLSLFAEEPRVRRRDRRRCGAKTRRGTRCRAPAVWDRALRSSHGHPVAASGWKAPLGIGPRYVAEVPLAEVRCQDTLAKVLVSRRCPESGEVPHSTFALASNR
jgi:hypothetical protein